MGSTEPSNLFPVGRPAGASASRPPWPPPISDCRSSVSRPKQVSVAAAVRTWDSPPARLATWSTCSSSRPTSPKPCNFARAGAGKPPIGLAARPPSRSSEGRHLRRTPPGASLGFANLGTPIVRHRRCLRRHQPPALLSRARSSRSRAGANSVPASASALWTTSGAPDLPPLRV